MDFGPVGFSRFAVGSDARSLRSYHRCSGFGTLGDWSDQETNLKWYGSGGLFKQERSRKVFKTESMLFPQRIISDGKGQKQQLQEQQQKFISFSCPTSHATISCFQLTSSDNNKHTGMHESLTGVRGPFTQSQWVDLQHQALIYKYMIANVPIPSNLLSPIRKSVESGRFSSFSGALLRPNSLTLRGFNRGFSRNCDPEPGRCRRTDGKKWRCSRDAVADQKYCERHMNRGRHRSRKPVEGQAGHSTAPTTVPMLSTCSASVPLARRYEDGGSSDVAMAQHHQHLKSLHQAISPNLSTAIPHSKLFLSKENKVERSEDAQGFSILSSSIDHNICGGNSLMNLKHDPYEDCTSSNQFGFISTDSFLNQSRESSSMTSCRTLDSSSSQDLTFDETVSQHSFCQFVVDWPKSNTDHSSISWPVEVDMQSDGSHLSSTSFPNNEKSSLSQIRLSHEHEPVHIGLGVGGGDLYDSQHQRPKNWVPISWETSMGGPLGEVLNHTSNKKPGCKNSSSLDLLNDD